jgi:hypothetical protein
LWPSPSMPRAATSTNSLPICSPSMVQLGQVRRHPRGQPFCRQCHEPARGRRLRGAVAGNDRQITLGQPHRVMPQSCGALRRSTAMARDVASCTALYSSFARRWVLPLRNGRLSNYCRVATARGSRLSDDAAAKGLGGPAVRREQSLFDSTTGRLRLAAGQ